MDIEQVFRRLTGEADVPTIRASWVERYLESPVSFWCDLYAPEELRDPIHPFVQHLFEVGQEHQSKVTAQSYPDAVQEIFLTEEEGFRRSLELMMSGEKYIKNMPLVCRPFGLEGRPDLLVRVDDIESNLGPHSYGVVEIKSARNIREAHVMQGAFYNRLLGIVQGVEPNEFYTINRDGDVRTIQMADVVNRLDEVLVEIRRVLSGGDVDPCYGTGKWPWETYVDLMAIERNDVSLLSGVGPARRGALIAAGFATVNDVAAAGIDSLILIKGVAAKTATNMTTSARALTGGQTIRRGPTPEMPRGKTEVFFDLEGTDPRLASDGLEVTNYLIGALWRPIGGIAQYVPFFAATSLDEQANLRSFLKWTHSLDDPVFYHWHHYEKTHITKMAQFYGLESSALEWVTGRMVDLSPLVTNSFAFPCRGQGLKDVAKALGFQWRQGGVDGLVSVVLYFRFVASGGEDKEAKEKILTYNEDDCLATMHIFDWLLEQRD